MSIKLRIVAVGMLVMFALAGATWWLRADRAARNPDLLANRSTETRLSAEEADQDFPPLIEKTPEMRRRSNWNPLDEIGSNRRCDQDSFRMMQNETPCIASPRNPNVLLVGANDFRLNEAAGFHRSLDGGLNWSDALQGVGPAGLGWCACDPATAADASGRLYATYLAFNCNGTGPSGVHT